jgi:hypothetical protein
MKFKWTVNKVKVAQDNLIVKVELTVSATDDNLKASAQYSRNLQRGSTFIPYEQLTEQQVLDWCFAPEVITWVDADKVEQFITKHLKDEGEAQVAGQIERQLAPKKSDPILPWAK